MTVITRADLRAAFAEALRPVARRILSGNHSLANHHMPVPTRAEQELMPTPSEWCWDPMPAVDGWFAVIRCWDPQEGLFPGAAWATGGKIEWPDNGGLSLDGSGHAGPFPTKEEALAWAEAHDPEGLLCS